MPKSAKQSPKKPAKVAAKRKKPTVKKPKSSFLPFLRFYHSENLRKKTLDTLDAVERAKDSRQHSAALADVVVELTDSGMDYFFLKPLRLAGAGFFTEQSANFGMTAATTMLAPVIRKIIGGMDGPQLLTVCGFMRGLME